MALFSERYPLLLKTKVCWVDGSASEPLYRTSQGVRHSSTPPSVTTASSGCVSRRTLDEDEVGGLWRPANVSGDVAVAAGEGGVMH
jgi:hypothetical protein